MDASRALKFMLINCALLLATGLIMVLSTSYIYASEHYNNSYYFVFRQIFFVFFGLSLAFLISKTRVSFWFKYSLHVHLLCTFLLILTFFPGVGITIKGAHRWVNMYIFSFQPSELIKYSTVLMAISFFEYFEKMDIKSRFKNGIILIAPLVFLVFQPDFGSFSICMFLLVFIAFLSNFPRKYFYGLVASGATISVIVLFSQAYRVQRMLTFLDPWKNPKTSGFQIIQSFLAFANGGVFGKGLGNSNEKLFYLPEAHNDFIFSVIGEELGFIGVLLLVLLFASFLYFGFLSRIISNSNLESSISTESDVYLFEEFFDVFSVLRIGYHG